MTRKNALITLAIVLVGAGVVAANLYYRRDTSITVTTDASGSRDLEAVVSAPERFSRLSSTSAPTRRAASSTLRSTRATASNEGSSSCRSIPGPCGRAWTAEPRRSRPRRCYSIR